MKIIKPSAEIVPIENMDYLEMMETAGRICYKSESKISGDSAPLFVADVIKKKHWSVTEFSVHTLQITINPAIIESFSKLNLKYLTIDVNEEGNILLITGTSRAFREAFIQNSRSSVLNLCIAHLQTKVPVLFDEFNPHVVSDSWDILTVDPAAMHVLDAHLQLRHRWAMVHYIVNRAVSHELVRHRPVSWLQESQRYCRYDKDQFGNEVTFIHPGGAFPKFVENSYHFAEWENSCMQAEAAYLNLLQSDGISPQAARTVLPNSCKTELYQLCNLEEWKIFFGLRTSPAAEPSMREVTIPLLEQFREKFPGLFEGEDD